MTKPPRAARMPYSGRADPTLAHAAGGNLAGQRPRLILRLTLAFAERRLPGRGA
jgi:hypothetical protein